MAGRRSIGGYGSGGGPTQDQERLSMYDRAVAAQRAPEQQAEKMDFQRQREAFLEAQRQAGTDIKQRQLETTNAFNQQKLESLQAERDAKQASYDATQAQQDLKNNHTAEVAKAATNIFKTLGTLDRTAPDFTSKLYGALADNPAAADHPAVMKAVEHELTTFDQQQSLKAKSQALNPTAAFQDSLAASQPVYGTADPNGKNFNAVAAGQGDQSHVQVTYLPPGAKQPTTQVFPRSVFDSAVAASQARQQQATPQQINTQPTAAPVVPVAAPVVQPAATVSAPVQLGGVTIGTPNAQAQAGGPQAVKLNPLSDDIAATARAAITAGKDPGAVRQRLIDNGYDASGL